MTKSEQNEITVKGFGKIDGSDSIRLLERDGKKLKVLFDGKVYNAIIRNENIEGKTFDIIISGFNFNVKIEEPIDQLINQLGFKKLKTSSVKEVKSPMPGLVVDVCVSEGESVQVGDKLISLEAMKMENILKSTTEGVVKKLYVQKGMSVDKNQLLIEFE